MRKFEVAGSLTIDLSCSLMGQTVEKVEEKMQLIMASIEDILGVNMMVQLDDASVHNVRFDHIESEVVDIEEDEEIEKSHNAFGEQSDLISNLQR